MPAPTYFLIASNTVGSGGAASVTFSSIPTTYTDLIIKISSRTNRAAIEDLTYLRFNGDAGGNYNGKQIYLDGPGANSSGGADYGITFYANGNTTTANTFSNAEVVVPSYRSASNKLASVDAVTENNGTYVTDVLRSGIWNNTAAITSISLTPNFGTFVQNSTFTLYGISNA